MVTPRVEASPDRSDFAKLGETIALEQAKQFADGIRSQVAEKSRELNFADTLLARGGTPSCNSAARLQRGKAQIIDGTGSLEAVRGRTPQPSPIPQRPLTVMTAHTLQSVHP